MGHTEARLELSVVHDGAVLTGVGVSAWVATSAQRFGTHRRD